MIVDCIEYVYDDEKVYKEFTRDEVKEFLLSLKVDDLSKIQRFFATMPMVEHVAEVDVGDEKRKVTLRGMKDFFTF